jgi:hypothetical protein
VKKRKSWVGCLFVSLALVALATPAYAEAPRATFTVSVVVQDACSVEISPHAGAVRAECTAGEASVRRGSDGATQAVGRGGSQPVRVSRSMAPQRDGASRAKVEIVTLSF